MFWFSASILDRPETVEERPVQFIVTDDDIGDTEIYTIPRYRGPSVNGEPASINGITCYAYDDTAGSVLVGVSSPLATPSGWTSKTLEEAKSQFEAVMGRPPTDQEVF
jgi:hypothetical protein